MNSERIGYIDTLRGFAIFLVTLGHVLEKSGYSSTPLFNFIYSFHMPLFFCISGFCMSLSFEKNAAKKTAISIKTASKFIYAKFKSIMIPYYAWSLLAIPLFFYCYNGTLEYKRILNSVFVANTSFWFLPCLFGLSVVYIMYKYLLSKLNEQHRHNAIIKILICILFSVVLFFFYNFVNYDFIRSLINYILPFFIGVFMSEYKKLNNFVCDNSYVYVFCLIAFCFIVGMFISPPNKAIEKASRLICGLVSIPILFNLFKNTNFYSKWKSSFEYIGRNTLIIYVLQSSFIKNMPIIPGLNIFMQISIFSVISLLLIALILLISKVIEKTTFTSQIFLGRT